MESKKEQEENLKKVIEALSLEYGVSLEDAEKIYVELIYQRNQ